METINGTATAKNHIIRGDFLDSGLFVHMCHLSCLDIAIFCHQARYSDQLAMDSDTAANGYGRAARNLQELRRVGFVSLTGSIGAWFRRVISLPIPGFAAATLTIKTANKAPRSSPVSIASSARDRAATPYLP